MTEKTKQAIVIAALVALGGVAAWGWMRKPVTNNGGFVSAFAGGVPPAYAQPMNVPYDGAQYASTGNSTAGTPCVTPAMYMVPAFATRDYVRSVRQVAPREVLVEQQPAPVTRYVERERESRGRTKTKSAVIVAGSAGAGAAIGAIAGGGKGAALGAMSGGVAGFVYDRLTHKR